MTREPEAMEQILGSFLRKKERVLLCFPLEGSRIGPALEEMVCRCGGVPVFWGEDLRWKTLLRMGFQERCGCIIGPPGVVLGLSKLAKRMGTPLHIRNAILVGEMPDEWLMNTVQESLDCTIRGCYCHLEDQPMDEAMLGLRCELRRWTTVLDYKLERSGAGLSLEMIVFPREKLPKLPSLAKLVIREWNPDRDCPFNIPLHWKNNDFSAENH